MVHKDIHSTHENIIRSKRFACWLERLDTHTNTHTHTHTHTQNSYELLQFTAFPCQQLLQNRVTMVRLYVYCLPCFVFVLSNCAVGQF